MVKITDMGAAGRAPLKLLDVLDEVAADAGAQLLRVLGHHLYRGNNLKGFKDQCLKAKARIILPLAIPKRVREVEVKDNSHQGSWHV